MADGSAVAFADSALVSAAAPLDADPVGTQSFCPIPTGPLVMRSVGMWYFEIPGIWRAPKHCGSSATTPGPPTNCSSLSGNAIAATSNAARCSGRNDVSIHGDALPDGAGDDAVGLLSLLPPHPLNSTVNPAARQTPDLLIEVPMSRSFFLYGRFRTPVLVNILQCLFMSSLRRQTGIPNGYGWAHASAVNQRGGCLTSPKRINESASRSEDILPAQRVR
uniref:hypothetical protein n=1 Tax=Burkholderia anthina TaxID=179879 RepID=UPI001FC8B66A|nr:hypothetical protein [Burkholderia anthina]